MKIFSLGDFSVGDSVTFERSFTPADFQTFSKLSGDKSPRHHDEAYTAKTSERTIVPLHLAMTPMSMIAGMVFPGEPGLYLSHDVRATAPIHYGETLRYSARIEDIDTSQGILSLSVLAMCGIEIVLDAAMRVKVALPQWLTPPALYVHKASQPEFALVTGANGEIGAAIALALARKGCKLLLQASVEDPHGKKLKDRLEGIGACVQFVTADLSVEKGRRELAAAIAKGEPLALVIHAASPKVAAPIDELVAVHFTALKAVADAALPGMLSRQKGAVMAFAPLATDRMPADWENYSATKSMATNFVANFDRRYASYNVRGLVLETAFSQDFGAGALLPAEIADAALRLVQVNMSVKAMRSNATFESSGKAELQASRAAAVPGPARTDVQETAQEQPLAPADNAALAAIVRRVLQLPADADLAQAGLGQTPSWDSLRHITLLLEIESTLGLKFASSEMGAVHAFPLLDALVRSKLAQTSNG